MQFPVFLLFLEMHSEFQPNFIKRIHLTQETSVMQVKEFQNFWNTLWPKIYQKYWKF